MDKRRLKEFTQLLDWNIEFTSGQGKLNTIKLPVPFAANTSPSKNILSLKGYKAYM